MTVNNVMLDAPAFCRIPFSRMRNLKITLAYDGTDFCGWQVQPAEHGIEGAVASAFGRVTGEKVLPQGSGRTDTGVHAMAQVASFVSETTIPLVNFRKVLNDRLPSAVCCLCVEEMLADFHARHSAIAKTYEYRVHRGDLVPPWLSRYVAHHPWP